MGRMIFATGSFETVMNLVDNYGGLTIIPKLVVLKMSEAKRQKLKSFSAPVPVRQVSLVALDSFPRQKLLQALQQEILQSLPESLKIKHELERRINI